MVLTTASDEEPEPQIDYGMCALPGSRLRVRGPVLDFNAPFVAVLGGTETFGKYVARPFPSLMQDWFEMPVVNLGVAHAGLSLFSDEAALLDIAAKSKVTVLQVLGAQNMSNRLYSVHSRRNDRFLGVSSALREIFPFVDFADINFTGHLITTLQNASEAAFNLLVDELKWAWVQRMRRILGLIDGDVILLWISDHEPVDARATKDLVEPHFVDGSMIEELQRDFSEIVTVVLSGTKTLDGKMFPASEADAALCLPGPAAHQRVADAIAPVVSQYIGASGGTERAARA